MIFYRSITSRSTLLGMIFHLHHYYTKRVYISVFNKRLITKHERRRPFHSQYEKFSFPLITNKLYTYVVHPDVPSFPLDRGRKRVRREGNNWYQNTHFRILARKTRVYCGHSNIKSKFVSTWFCRRTKLEKCPNFFSAATWCGKVSPSFWLLSSCQVRYSIVTKLKLSTKRNKSRSHAGIVSGVLERHSSRGRVGNPSYYLRSIWLQSPESLFNTHHKIIAEPDHCRCHWKLSMANQNPIKYDLPPK